MISRNHISIAPLLASLTVLASIATPAAANIVQNPGFEASFASWTANTDANNPWHPYTSNPVIGTLSASTGCVGAKCTDQTNLASAAYLYQDLATTVGALYDLSFVFTPNSSGPNELKVLWAGAVALDLVNVPNMGGFVSHGVGSLLATSSTTRLTFLGRQDSGFDRLDTVNVQLSAVRGVPEPPSWALMATGFAVAGAMAGRQRILGRGLR